MIVNHERIVCRTVQRAVRVVERERLNRKGGSVSRATDEQLQAAKDWFGRRADREMQALACDVVVTGYRAWLEDRNVVRPLGIEFDRFGRPIFDFLRFLFELGVENEWTLLRYVFENLPAIIAAIIAAVGDAAA